MTDSTTHNPDEIMRQAVLQSLTADARRAFGAVRVGVLNGIVHLAGGVSTLDLRQKAVDLAGRIPGVRGVVNRIDAPGAPPPARPVNLNLGEDNDKVPE